MTDHTYLTPPEAPSLRKELQESALLFALALLVTAGVAGIAALLP